MHSLHYFPGSNTPLGFYSYFSHILPKEQIKNCVILKGGPGTGKSTLMKKVFHLLNSRGLSCNLLHCSSDPDSLDAICAPEIGFIMLDGTSPHTIDPVLPGCRDEILSLGMYWDARSITKHKQEIEDINRKISSDFSAAYDYLRAAQSVLNHIKKCQRAQNDDKAIQECIQTLILALNLNNLDYGFASTQKAFADAFTPQGHISYINSYAEIANKIICIDTQNVSEILTPLSVYMTHCNLKQNIFYDPMYPETEILHIYLPDQNILLTGDKSVCNESKTEIYSANTVAVEMQRADTDLYNILLSRAISHLQKAKKKHDELEHYYIPYMDFNAMENLSDNIVKTLL